MEGISEVYDEDCIQEEIPELEEERIADPGEEGLADHEMGISMHAVSGEKPQETIKVQGEAKGQSLTILIDTGSTHSFMDLQMARNLKAQLVIATPLIVTVVNGQKVLSKLQCPRFFWTMQGHRFQADLRIIRLEGSSVVLGIDWLRSYGKITFDFQQNLITVLKGGASGPKGDERRSQSETDISKPVVSRVTAGGCCVVRQCSNSNSGEGQAIDSRVSRILEHCGDVFEEPKRLPPPRFEDHRIPLQPGATPVNLRPYRHSHEQKGEIER